MTTSEEQIDLDGDYAKKSVVNLHNAMSLVHKTLGEAKYIYVDNGSATQIVAVLNDEGVVICEEIDPQIAPVMVMYLNMIDVMSKLINVCVVSCERNEASAKSD